MVLNELAIGRNFQTEGAIKLTLKLKLFIQKRNSGKLFVIRLWFQRIIPFFEIHSNLYISEVMLLSSLS